MCSVREHGSTANRDARLWGVLGPWELPSASFRLTKAKSGCFSLSDFWSKPLRMDMTKIVQVRVDSGLCAVKGAGFRDVLFLGDIPVNTHDELDLSSANCMLQLVLSYAAKEASDSQTGGAQTRSSRPSGTDIGRPKMVIAPSFAEVTATAPVTKHGARSNRGLAKRREAAKVHPVSPAYKVA